MLSLSEKNVICIVSGITGIEVTAKTQERITQLLDKGNELLSGKTDYQKEIAFKILSLSDEEIGRNFFDLRTIASSHPAAWINIVHDLGITQEDSYLTKLNIIRGNQTINNISLFSKEGIVELERDLGKNVLSITQEQWQKWFGYLIKKRFRVDFKSSQKNIPTEGMVKLLTALGNKDF